MRLPSKISSFVLLLSLLISLASAQNVRRAIPVVPSAAPGPSGVVTIDDQARFLAGVPGRSNSPLKPLEDTRAWKEHASASDELWNRAQRGRHVQMRDWSQSNILPRVGTPQTLYYMFGGPDFVTAQVFFPGTGNIILAGLEPVGQVPDLRSLSADQLDSSLQNLRRTMGAVLKLGFFETKNMKIDLHRTPVQGVKPMVYAMLVRAGETLLDESYFSIAGNGAPSYTKGMPSGAVTGFKIDYRPTSGGGTRACYYLSGNIANGAEVSRITSFLSRFPSPGSYLKAASYLMHESSFSTIKNFLLSRSRFILQDDSGIPLTSFDSGQWEIIPFGNYEGVMPVFGKYYQTALRQLYDGGSQPMPFGVGYRVKDSQANQILAIRR